MRTARSVVEVDGGHDLDGDGTPDFLLGFRSTPATRPDVIVASGATGAFLALLDVNGSFTVPSNVQPVVAGDLDRDGVRDVLVAAGEASIGRGAALAFVTESLGVAYCVATPNSSGVPAHIVAAGSTSVARNDLTLTASPVPAAFGLLIQGDAVAAAPLGAGILCVGGTLARSAPQASTAGTLRIILDLPAPAAIVVAGSTWNFQCWFRDAGGGVALTNFSDAVHLEFRP